MKIKYRNCEIECTIDKALSAKQDFNISDYMLAEKLSF